MFQISLVFVDLGSFEEYSNWSWLPWWISGNEPAFQCRRHEFDPLGREDPLEKEMATYASILAWGNQ